MHERFKMLKQVGQSSNHWIVVADKYKVGRRGFLKQGIDQGVEAIGKNVIFNPRKPESANMGHPSRE